jgi:hypothetical protein
MKLSDSVRTKEDLWRFEYNIRPYLRHVPDEELGVRRDDILRNVITLTRDGKVGLHPPDLYGDFWYRRLIHFHHECSERGKDSTKIGSDAPLDFHGCADYREIVKRNSALFDFTPQGVFCKYGKAEYMESLLKEGQAYIAPVSSYKSDHHNDARKDDEMVFTTFISPYDYDLNLVDPWIRRLYPERSHKAIEFNKPSDHYLYCLTTKFDLRFFYDFKDDGSGTYAQSCVIINNQQEFENRLIADVKNKLPGWSILFSNANYIDPYYFTRIIPNDEIILYFVKRSRFIYQREFRLVAVPPATYSRQLEPFIVSLGSLEDIAQMVSINQ